jgi:hypothetical protein
MKKFTRIFQRQSGALISMMQLCDCRNKSETAHVNLDNLVAERNFFFGHRNPELGMRWLHVENPDILSVLKLSVKYGFHPIATEVSYLLQKKE